MPAGQFGCPDSVPSQVAGEGEMPNPPKPTAFGCFRSTFFSDAAMSLEYPPSNLGGQAGGVREVGGGRWGRCGGGDGGSTRLNTSDQY